MKKTPSKIAHKVPNFFSVLPTGPKSAQITFCSIRNAQHMTYVYLMTLGRVFDCGHDETF